MKRKYEIAVLSKGAFARTVRIFAPKKADRAIIMHDGQNVFYDEDATYKKSWRAIDMLKAAEIKNTAIIGIDSAVTRNDDYLPFPPENAESYSIKLVGGGKADVYMDYIEQIILPYLDKRFGYKFYGMLGSSAGGLATLYFAARKNARLRAYGMFSTPLFVSPTAFGKFFGSATFDKDAYYKVYVGGSECTGEVPTALKDKETQLFVTDSYTITDTLRNSGVKNLDLTVTNTSGHDEAAWREPELDFFKKFSRL
ncbi:MAG: hypothetical protein K2O04_07925 [Clostridiales bacterium]|nr:hypothetical protein [Clostridiales bacterium]